MRRMKKKGSDINVGEMKDKDRRGRGWCVCVCVSQNSI